ncbi:MULTISPECIES: hypothetical protein [Streptomyces]|uniref:hypothetical protein n=1 Tax=Streptomyces TaxID=1883 RepID=UPI001678E700|nr:MULTISPECIES: hypothetical protein [Streptomyces]MBK3524869.1 hypothetical protein [Streptomyces sp. MBT70]GGR70816.1 hypothetical protein GCM10010236_26300 [Streptomyces eurythermus]
MFGLTTTRRLRIELAAAEAEIARQRRRADLAEDDAATAVYTRRQLLRQLAEADAANRRLYTRDRHITDRAAALERRVARLLKVGARLLAARDAEQQRADHLQQRLDDALGLNTAAVIAGRHWQSHREDGGRRVAS